MATQGHDHDHDHVHGLLHVEDGNKPVFIAAVIIIAFCAGAYYLVMAGTAARAAARGPAGDHAAAGHSAAGSASSREPTTDRASFVATFDKRQRNLGFTLRAKTAGPRDETFEIRWDGTPEPGKIEAIKSAAQLHVEARSRGFKKIAIVVNGKTVWEKAL